MFDTQVTNTLLIPLYSSVTFIEFGTFFQRLDSIFILIWIISFVSYISIIINTCCHIVKKTTTIKSSKFICTVIAFFMLIVTSFSKTYAVSTFLTEIVYKYSFFIILGISIAVLLVAVIFKNSKKKKLNILNTINGGIH